MLGPLHIHSADEYMREIHKEGGYKAALSL
jgi:hypothetical protein